MTNIRYVPLIHSIILSMTSWGHRDDILGTSCGHLWENLETYSIYFVYYIRWNKTSFIKGPGRGGGDGGLPPILP